MIGKWQYLARRDDGYRGAELSEYKYEGSEPFLLLDDIARGEDLGGQSTTTQRSNFRELQSAFPDTFTEIHYSNVDVLGIFESDITEEVQDLLDQFENGLIEYDEDDVSALEQEEIEESIRDYVVWDVRSCMEGHEKDIWDELGEDTQVDLIREVEDANEGNPLGWHDGRETHWDYDRMMEPLLVKLSDLDEDNPSDPV